MKPSDANAQMKDIEETAEIAAVVDKLDALKAIATELFERVESLEVANDPEIPLSRYVTIAVRAKGSVRAVAELHREWHKRIEWLLGPNHSLVHLAIDIVQGE